MSEDGVGGEGIGGGDPRPAARAAGRTAAITRITGVIALAALVVLVGGGAMGVAPTLIIAGIIAVAAATVTLAILFAVSRRWGPTVLAMAGVVGFALLFTEPEPTAIPVGPFLVAVIGSAGAVIAALRAPSR